MKIPFPEVIDNTARSAYRKCPQYFSYYILQHLRPKGLPNIHLRAGSALAKGLEVARISFYQKGFDVEQAEYHGKLALIKEYGEEAGAEEAEFGASRGNKSLDRTIAAYESYLLEYALATDSVKPFRFPNGICGAEFTFAVAIPSTVHPETGNPLIYAGKFDMLGVYQDKLWCVDEKTTTQLGASWRNNWVLDSQFTGYTWAAKQYGFPVVGTIIRGIGMLKEKTTHQQVPVYRTQWQIDRWLAQLQDELEDMVRDWKRNKFRLALDKMMCAAYGGCIYNTLCETPEPERWIPIHYEVSPWDPLAKGNGS